MRVCRGVQDRHQPALRDPEQDGLPRVDRVENRAHVVHLLLERGQLERAIGQARTARIEHHEAREAAKAPQERGVCRQLPLVIEVAEDPLREQEVARSGPEGLVGEMDAAVAGVGDLGRVHRAPRVGYG